MFLFLRRYLARPIIISLIIIGVYEGMSLGFGTFSKVKLITRDLSIRLKYRLKPVPRETKDIAIISIDNRAYDWFGKKWPWGREIFAELIYRLSDFQPKVIGLNLAFIGASQNPAVDDLLSHSIETAGNVITASYFDKDGSYHAPYEKFAASSKGFGFTNKPIDKDQVIRRTRLFTRTVHNIILDYSFELKVTCAFLGIPFENLDFNGKEVIIREDWKIPANIDGTIPLDYSARLEDFQLIPVLDILQNKVPQESIKDKIVIMCLTGEAFRDIQKTPFGPFPGAAIIANNILMFLGNRYIKEVPERISILLLIIIAIFFGVITYKSSVIKGLLYLVASILIFYLVSIILIIQNIYWDLFSIPFIMTAIFAVNNLYRNIGTLVENAILKRRLIRDPVTGLATRYYLMVKLQKELDSVNRKGGYLSLAIFRIKDLSALKKVAALIKKNSRRTRHIDFISHYAEDRFCVILRNTTGEQTRLYTERIKDVITKETNIPLSTSICVYPLIKTNSADTFIQEAEKNLS